ADDPGGKAVQDTAGQEARLGAARGRGVEDDVGPGVSELTQQLADGGSEAQRPEWGGGAEGDDVGAPAGGSQPHGRALHGRCAILSSGNVLDLGAEYPVEQRVAGQAPRPAR